MNKTGRPITLTKSEIASRCYSLYWEKGINNVTYNEAIKYSGISKASVYKIFDDHDDLQKETIRYYSKKYVSMYLKEFEKFEDIFDMTKFFTKYIMSKKFSPCYFYTSNTRRSQLGKKSKKYLKTVERYLKKNIEKSICKHITSNKLCSINIRIKSLSVYIFHNISLMNNLILNRYNAKDIKEVKNSIYEKLLISLK